MASLSETLPRKSNENMENFEEPNTSLSCGCLEKLCSGWSAKRDESVDSLLAHQPEDARGTWFMRNLKKVHHVSGSLGGSKWKNFIRTSGTRGVGKKRRTRFHYDQCSYKLNFDDGFERGESLHPKF